MPRVFHVFRAFRCFLAAPLAFGWISPQLAHFGLRVSHHAVAVTVFAFGDVRLVNDGGVFVDVDPGKGPGTSPFLDGLRQRRDLIPVRAVLESVCELVWVLESAYGYPKETILEVLEKLLLTRQFKIERKDQVWTALSEFRSGQGDFADYLIGSANVSAGCECTVTFDRSLKNASSFRLL